jgi:WD40 repeat protein
VTSLVLLAGLFPSAPTPPDALTAVSGGAASIAHALAGGRPTAARADGPARPESPDPTRFEVLVNAKVELNVGGDWPLDPAARVQLSFSGDGSLMCVLGYVFHLPTREVVGRVTGVDAWNTAVLSPDGKHLAVAGDRWALWKVPADQLPGGAKFNRKGLCLAPGDQIKFAPAPESIGKLVAVAFSPDGTRLAGCTGGGDLGVWDVKTGKLQASARTGRTTAWVAFGADGKRLLAWGNGAKDTPVGWDLAAQTGDPLPDAFRGQRQFEKRVAVDPSGALAAETVWGTGGKKYDPQVVLWSAAGGAPAVVKVPDVDVVAPAPDGRTVATATRFADVRVHPTGLGGKGTTLLPASAVKGEGKVSALAFAPGGKYLVAVVNDHRVLVFGPPAAAAAGERTAADGLFPVARGARWIYAEKNGNQLYQLERVVGAEQTINNLKCTTAVATALIPQKQPGKPALRGGTANEYWTRDAAGWKVVLPDRGEKSSSPFTNSLPRNPDGEPLLVVPAAGTGKWRADVGPPGGPAAVMECVAVEAQVQTPAGKAAGIAVTMTVDRGTGPADVYRWWFAKDVGLVKYHATTGQGEFLTELTKFEPGK